MVRLTCANLTSLCLLVLRHFSAAVIAACRENNVAILAYSPLGRGFLSGKYTKPEDLEGEKS